MFDDNKYNWRKVQLSVAGYFHQVTLRSDGTTPPDEASAVIALCGKLSVETIKPEMIEYFKQFYGKSNFNHALSKTWPENFMPKYPSDKINWPNGYLILTKEKN